MSLIKLTNVSKEYSLNHKNAEQVLKNINLEINSREMVAICGPSGSGKSTLMHIIGLLDRPSTGEIQIAGEPITLSMSDKKLATLRNQKIGFVFQTFNLLPRLSALENVMLPTIYDKRDKPYAFCRALSLLKKVGLGNRLKHKPTALSGGERQRVAIARALINDPDIILADEPTGNLDSVTGGQIMEILKDLNKNGKTLIIVTHDDKIASLCQRVIRILDGQIESTEAAPNNDLQTIADFGGRLV
jgi:putative ABC transport system ATP-binding protein